MSKKKAVKIKGVTLKNFAKFNNLTIEFDDQVTKLIGMNGDGKTTIFKAIQVAFKGLASKGKDGQLIGDRFRFIGSNGASSDIVVRLIDERLGPDEIIVRRHLTKDTSTMDFTAPKGYDIDANWLKGLLSVAFMSAKNFGQLSGQEQALVLGINTREFDIELAELKKKYTEINTRLRAFGEIESLEKVERVDGYALVQERDKIDEFNRLQKERAVLRNNADESINYAKEKIEKLKKELEEQEANIRVYNKTKNGIPEPEKLKSTDEINEKLKNVDETNKKAMAYDENKRKKEARDKVKEELDNNKAKQKEVSGERLDYIKGFDFGFKGLSVGDDGSLLLNGNPINHTYLSNGELETIVAKFRKYTNPDLKVIFIDDFDLLDERRGPALVDELLTEGYQIIVALVGDKKKGQNSVVLRDCGLVTDEQEKESLL